MGRLDALIYSVIGYAIVFAGIIVLVAIIWAFAKFIAIRKKDEKPEIVETPTAEEVEIVEENVDDKIKIAIIGAIMSFYSESGRKCDFVVKRIKRAK